MAATAQNQKAPTPKAQKQKPISGEGRSISSLYAVLDGDMQILAIPIEDGTVSLLGQNWDRSQWMEFVGQVNGLYDIAEGEQGNVIAE